MGFERHGFYHSKHVLIFDSIHAIKDCMADLHLQLTSAKGFHLYDWHKARSFDEPALAVISADAQ
jgi:hypothetical protein